VGNADKVVVALASGSENRPIDGHRYTYPDDTTDKPDAAQFSNDDLNINGSGSLTVTAANDGLKGRDMVGVREGFVTTSVGGDGFQASNADDAALGYVVIEGGTCVVYVGGSSIGPAVDGLHADGVYTRAPSAAPSPLSRDDRCRRTGRRPGPGGKEPPPGPPEPFSGGRLRPDW
jgi:hypothetical protein